ncbi:hypothetical protein NC796_24155 [Aliifodinibius sp. S!AR15-10]|uniref:hypothetical protein n=1 Tax=Aliifodinibius sp. S!AR15-10 TaxID=2950437 RepID=UPI002855D48D|nr:hypothetical protein [Aliifodinibius sp. S!AR15-10]MDR8394264.1 hypothetical protein [Aliifodinibius sp. S!AR15-10]
MTDFTREEVTQEQLDQLVEDASYLQDEAEALKYVIDEVPYTDAPPEGQSIAEMLLLIDHAQLSYYRPIIEDAYQSDRPTHLKDYDHFEETFSLDEDKAKDIQKSLSKIAKHRAGLVNLIKKISLIDWELVVYRDGSEILLFDFAQEMIRFERGKLKDIADLVMVFNQEKATQRKIDKRANNRPSANQQSQPDN